MKGRSFGLLFYCISLLLGGAAGPGVEPSHQSPVPGAGRSVHRHGRAAGVCRPLVSQSFPIHCAFLLHHSYQVHFALERHCCNNNNGLFVMLI